jgi:DNA invertase Pin-like site-specific DNA recombinase
MSIYGYCRVSTKGQSKDGNSLESQESILIEKGCQEVVRESFTGTKCDRPLFTELINKLQSGDTLMVTKLDRFARNTIDGLTVIKNFLDKNISVHILNMGLIDNTSTGKLILTIMLGFAEFERDMIVERTQTGKAIAKTKTGFKEGRPKEYTETQINMAIDLLKEHSYSEVERMTKISKSTLTREVRKRKVIADR